MDLKFHDTYQITLERAGLRFDYLLHLRRKAEKLLVILPNAIPEKLRAEGKLPYFPRWSWIEEIKHSVVIVNDPVLFLNDKVLLGWMAGTKDAYATELCLETLDEIMDSHKLTEDRLVLFGSSGGGFVGLVMGARRPKATVIADIPQTNILQYYERLWRAGLDVYYPGETAESLLAAWPERFVALEAFRKYSIPSRIHYLQALTDHFHYTGHFLPFVTGFDSLPDEKKRHTELRVMLYDHGLDGHQTLDKSKMLALINGL